MALAETIGMWFATAAYAAASALFVVSFVFGREGAGRVAFFASAAGLSAHGVGIVVRWIRVGHGPYLGFYEIASLLAFLGVGAFTWLVWRHRGLAALGTVLMPVTFLMLGGAMLASKEAVPVSGALASFWLIIHVAFANLAYGAYAAAFVLAGGYLLRARAREGRLRASLNRLPAQEVTDDLTFRFVGAGFLFQGVMIASGAIWANEAWGRYWGWDPMETWSLVAWAVYAVYLHLRLTLGWKGERAAWVAVVSLPIIVFSLLGVPLAYPSIHGAYLAW